MDLLIYPGNRRSLQFENIRNMEVLQTRGFSTFGISTAMRDSTNKRMDSTKQKCEFGQLWDSTKASLTSKNEDGTFILVCVLKEPQL